MNIRAIALDLDRTTLNEEGRLSASNRAALRQAVENGVQLIVASGRAYDTLPAEIRNFSGIEYAVTGNGAAMYHVPTGTCLRRHLLKEKDVLSILKETAAEPIMYEAFVDGVAYAGKEYVVHPKAYGASQQSVNYVRSTRNLLDNIAGFIMDNCAVLDSMDLIVAEEKKKEELWKRVEGCTEEVYITSSIRQLIEISHRNAGKHKGVAYIAGLLGLRREEIAAFGDADNDVDLLAYAGCGIAMENASGKCKAAADYVTKHHDQDGVAYGIKEILHVI